MTKQQIDQLPDGTVLDGRDVIIDNLAKIHNNGFWQYPTLTKKQRRNIPTREVNGKIVIDRVNGLSHEQQMTRGYLV